MQAEGKQRLILKGAEADGSAAIGSESVIEQGAYIGADCRLQGALIMSGSSAGEGCLFKSCVIGENVTIGRGCFFGELSAVGEECVIGSAVTVDPGVRIECGLKIPSGAHIRSDMGTTGYKPMELSEGGEVTGLEREESALMRLGMAIAKGLALEKITVAAANSGSTVSEAISLGLRCGSAKVYSLENVSFGESVFAARRLKTKYTLFIGEKIRLIRSDRIELSRSEERAVEQSYNRGELKSVAAAPQINAEAEASLYEDELASRLPKELNASVILESDSMAEGEVFIRALKRSGLDSSQGERIVFHSCGEGRGLFCSLQSLEIPYEKLILLGCMAKSETGGSIRLPYSAPYLCEEVAKSGGLSLTRVSCSDDLELSDFSYDSLFLIADILSYLAKSGITMSHAVTLLPDIIYTHRTVEIEEGLPKILGESFRKNRRGRDIVLESSGARACLRPLKSGKSLALYLESVSSEAANSLCEEIIRRVRGQM